MQVVHTADCFGGAWFKSPLVKVNECIEYKLPSLSLTKFL